MSNPDSCVTPRLTKGKVLLCSLVALATSLPASADDLDVFKAVLASQNKPNIMFVLDYSGSMNENVLNEAVSASEPAKIDVLREAVTALINDNAGRINVGIASMYKDKASGVRWPASDLQADAHTLDPNIPVGTKTVADIIESLLYNMDAGGSTATVNALAEAAAYYRGEPVLSGDANQSTPWNFEPDVWDNADGEYDWGNSFAALPTSYLPRDAYSVNTSTGTGSYQWCTNYVGGTQGCDGKITFDCDSYDAEDWEDEWEDDSGNTHTGSGTTAARTVCKYEHGDEWLGANYESPITQECQANFIVLISDGQPTEQRDNTTLQSAVGGLPSTCADLSSTIFATASSNQSTGNCGPEIVNRLANNDVDATIPDSVVNTYTVGFSLEGSGKEYLKLLASEGNGEFYEAAKPEELTKALNDVIDDILAGSENFVELAVDVDRDSFSHDDQTYFSLFSPSSRGGWKGNLKGYFIDSTGLLDTNGAIATVNDGSGTKFADATQSFWSATPDGNDIEKGGVSEQLENVAAAARKLYTFTGDHTSITGSGIALATHADHELASANAGITDALMGLSSGSVVRDAALDWIQRAPMGDPLHTKPVIVNYPGKKVVYVMTNQGFIHAIDATRPAGMTPADHGGGEELFAFMPKELLDNLPLLFEGKSQPEHIYGLDGGMTRWHNDLNKNGIVDGSESVKLIFGMRRGGSHYYALDVTNTSSPKLAWQIDGGVAPFNALAQSWSRPSLITVNDAGTANRVLVFAGGYDAATVDNTAAPTPASGNAIYMVDEDGDLVWSMSSADNADMQYSIPSDVTVIDSDEDGIADRLYVGDLGGQVWRVDFDNVRNSGGFVATRLASIGGGGHQPIFYAPSVAMNRAGGKRFLSVAVGTGDRTDPLNSSSNNAVFMIRDEDVEKGAPAGGFTTITDTDLYDATDNNIASTSASVQSAAQTALDSKRGWKIYLATGEKALSGVVSFEGKLLATTFQPLGASATNSCDFQSQGRLYIMGIKDARPVKILSDGTESDSSVSASARITELGGTTIPTKAKVLYTKDSKAQIVVGKEVMTEVKQRVNTVFWHAR